MTHPNRYRVMELQLNRHRCKFLHEAKHHVVLDLGTQTGEVLVARSATDHLSSIPLYFRGAERRIQRVEDVVKPD